MARPASGVSMECFSARQGYLLPVSIRLLDPPLHQFRPQTQAEMADVAKAMCAPIGKLKARALDRHAFNPMLGFSGVRIANAYPEGAEMQTRAVFEGAAEARRGTGQPVKAEIMVPLVMVKPELNLIRARIVATAEAVAKESEAVILIAVGTMIELPRAALVAASPTAASMRPRRKPTKYMSSVWPQFRLGGEVSEQRHRKPGTLLRHRKRPRSNAGRMSDSPSWSCDRIGWTQLYFSGLSSSFRIT